jgi:biopolymer transport protein ExbB/TolQ
MILTILGYIIIFGMIMWGALFVAIIAWTGVQIALHPMQYLEQRRQDRELEHKAREAWRRREVEKERQQLEAMRQWPLFIAGQKFRRWLRKVGV